MENDSVEIDLLRYLFILRRWAWLLILGALLAGGAAFLISRQITPIYQTSTTLLVNPASGGGSASAEYQSILLSERLAQTYATVMVSRPILQQAIDSLGLTMSPGYLAGRVTAAPVRNTQLLRLTVTGEDPAQIAAIANEIVAIFVRQNAALQSSRFDATRTSLEAELAKIQEEIDATQALLDQATGAANAGERARLQDLLALYRTSYASLLRSIEEIRLTEVRQSDSVIMIDPAITPVNPISPRVMQNALIAAVVGLMLMFGLVLLLEFFNDRVGSSDKAGEMLGTTVLAT
ncbi:MAG: protein tyrosine kinase, partial [Chloroflexia bacterium]|nr:protein tyrosine kinase [Chloroflexia bacterium]